MARCPKEDCATPGVIETPEAASEILAPTITLISMDFAALSAYNTTVADINVAYLGSALSGITGDLRPEVGCYM